MKWGIIIFFNSANCQISRKNSIFNHNFLAKFDLKNIIILHNNIKIFYVNINQWINVKIFFNKIIFLNLFWDFNSVKYKCIQNWASHFYDFLAKFNFEKLTYNIVIFLTFWVKMSIFNFLKMSIQSSAKCIKIWILLL